MIYVRRYNPTHVSVEEKGRCGTENHYFQTSKDLATECSYLDPENILIPVTLLRLSLHNICSDIFDGDQGAEAKGTELQNKDPRVLCAINILETKMIVHLDHISMRQRYLEGSK